MIDVDLALLSFLGGTVVPALVALVAARVASARTKAVLNAVLTLVAGLVATALSGGGLLTEKAAVAVCYAWVASVATHYGLLRPAGVTGANGVIAQAVPGGIGGRRA